MSGPRILLIVGGGIAAYKACELVRLIRRAGGDVTCVLTEGGSNFVTPMTLAALSENPVYTSLWDLKNETEMGHIQLSRAADLIVVCPATADLIAKMNAGIADDLATTLLLATDKPVMAVPAMNVRMWQHAATMRNVSTLRECGVHVMEPDEGEMACGEFGPGRLPEPTVILAEIAAVLALEFAPDVYSIAPPIDVELTLDHESLADEAGPELFSGLSGIIIARSTKNSAIRFDDDGEVEFPIDGEEFLPEELQELGMGEQEWLPEELLPAELPGEPLPEIDPLASPLVVKKGKARAAPPTDPEAINHLVSTKEDAAPPEPFEGEAAAVPSGQPVAELVVEREAPADEAAPPADAADGVLADPLEGQPDFAEEPAHRPLFGKHVLITAGPTHEAIDPVRFIANKSSGKQGFAIAAAAAAAGARVTLIAGPVSLETPPGVDRIDIVTALQMAAAVEASLPADVAVMVAAVADWRVTETAGDKLKKRGSAPPALRLIENPDILAGLSANRRRPGLVIGFAAETSNLLANAKEKRERKGADWIVANDVSGDVMGGAKNKVQIVTKKGIESLPKMPKEDVARALVEKIAEALEAADAE